MARVPYVAALLTLAMAVQEYHGKPERIRCPSQTPCFDLLTMERMVYRLSKDVPGADNDNILVKSKTFDKIRHKKYLHSCVLEKIIKFYENVLSNIEFTQNNHLELLSALDRVRNCTYKVKRCDRLYQKARQQAELEIAEADMSAQEVAIFQLKKLNHANENLNDTTVRKTAMDELKSLHHYIPGSAFRNTNG